MGEQQKHNEEEESNKKEEREYAYAVEETQTAPRTDYRMAFSPALIGFAHFISYIFHPLLVLTYIFLISSWAHPYAFRHGTVERVLSDPTHQYIFINIVMFTFIVPVLAVFIMRALGLVKDIALTDRSDRIGPYILSGLFYIIIFMSMNEASTVPLSFKIFTLGATIGLFMAFFVNLFSKISAHTVGMGGFLAMLLMLVTIFKPGYANYELIFIIGIVICGLVGSARRLVSDHEPADIYGGYVIGFLSQFVALNFLYPSDPSQITSMLF